MEYIYFMTRFSLMSFPIRNKTVLLRVDYNVPVKGRKILDDSKLKATLPTLKHLLSENCKIIVATHLGRPNGRIVSELKTNILAKELQRLLPKEKITKLNDSIGTKIKKKIDKGEVKEIFFLENLRFYKGEEENDPAFAHSLASLAEVYVNDAFGVSHRKHASLDKITNFLPAVAGLLMEIEIINLNKAIKPKRPVIWILGGAKLDKLDLIEQALKKADYVLLGGALPFPFLKAQGISVGMSKCDAASIRFAKKILQKKEAKKLVLPLDFSVAEQFSVRAKVKTVLFNQIQPGQIGLDLGPETIKFFKKYLRKARTIVWNGPLGYYEWNQFASSTRDIGRYLGTLTAAIICGGGETQDAIKKFHLEHKISRLSTGGGATVNFLEGKRLPALDALLRNYKRFKKIVKKQTEIETLN